MSDINTFNNVNLRNNFIKDAKVTTPSASQDIVNKEYVDKKIEGMVSGVFWGNLTSKKNILNKTVSIQDFVNAIYEDTTHTVKDFNSDLKKLSINTPLYICYQLINTVKAGVCTCNYGMLNYNESSTNPIKCTVLNLKYNIPVPTLTYNTQVGLQITFNSTTVSITQENKLVLMTDDYSANNEYQPLSTKSGNDLYQMILNRKADPVGDTLPIGSVVEWFSNTIPTNWLSCNGQAVSRTEYAELFKILGTKYGSGDGSTTFNLPNIKGKVSVGLNVDDTDFNTLGKTGGEKTHTLTIAELASHTHTFTGNPHTHTYSKSNSTSGSTTLTVNQIPSHSHGIYATANPGTGGINFTDQAVLRVFNGNEILIYKVVEYR